MEVSWREGVPLEEGLAGKDDFFEDLEREGDTKGVSDRQEKMGARREDFLEALIESGVP